MTETIQTMWILFWWERERHLKNNGVLLPYSTATTTKKEFPQIILLSAFFYSLITNLMKAR